MQQFDAWHVCLYLNISMCGQADIDHPRCEAAANKNSSDAWLEVLSGWRLQNLNGPLLHSDSLSHSQGFMFNPER